MLYYDRIDLSEAIDLGKSNCSKECMVYHYWFFNHGFKYQDSVCNGCHDLLMQCFSISDITIITVNGADYCCIIILLYYYCYIQLANLKQLIH